MDSCISHLPCGLCGKIPLIIVPGVVRQYRLLLTRKGDFDGKGSSACTGRGFSSSFMVALLSGVLKFEDWHEWFYFLSLLYILESIKYLMFCLTIQMFLLFHLIIAHLLPCSIAIGLENGQAMCLWMGIIMMEDLFSSCYRILWGCP